METGEIDKFDAEKANIHQTVMVSASENRLLQQYRLNPDQIFNEIGLINYHNSCALNVLLQTLYHIPKIQDYLTQYEKGEVFIEFLNKMDQTKRIISPKPIIEKLSIEPNSYIDDLFEPVFMNLTEAGITIERRFITGNEENPPEFHNEIQKQTFFDIETSDVINELQKFINNTYNEEFLKCKTKFIHMGKILIFRNIQRNAGSGDHFEFPENFVFVNNEYKLRVVINFIPGREINHFTCLIIKKNIQILLNDKIILEKFLDPSTTYMGLYLKVEKSKSQQKKDLSCYLKRLRPHDDSELSLSFKQSKIFTEAFLDESFFVKPLYFHDDEIERLTSLLYYFEK